MPDEESLPICEVCEEEYPEDELEYSEILEQTVCECCLSDLVCSCDGCGIEVETEGTHSFDNDIMCDSCYQENVVFCDNCNEEIWIDDSVSHNYDYYCQECFEEIYCYCDNCEAIIYREDVYCRDDQILCDYCYSESGSEGIRSWNYAPTIRFYADGAGGTSVTSEPPKKGIATYGVEVELVTNEIQECIDILDEGNEDEFLYYMEDGSVCNGFEIATLPFTFNWMNKNKKRFDNMFSLERFGLARSFSAQECGMHVHLGRFGFVSRLHRYKFANLFYENEDMVLSVSRRRPDRLEQWAKTKLSCKLSAMVLSRNNASQGRYHAINFCPDNTIECRIFRGTLSPTGFFANMEFMEAAFQFSRHNGLRDMRVENFVRYANDNRKIYPAFCSMFAPMLAELR